MNNLQFLLNKLAEECIEVAKPALKAAQFGLVANDKGNNYDNLSDIHKELNDLLAIVEMLNNECGFNFVSNNAAIANKKCQVEMYREVSRKLGFVNTDSSHYDHI